MIYRYILYIQIFRLTLTHVQAQMLNIRWENSAIFTDRSVKVLNKLPFFFCFKLLFQHHDKTSKFIQIELISHKRETLSNFMWRDTFL